MKQILESIQKRRALHESEVIESESGVRFRVREYPNDNQIFIKVDSPYDLTDYYWAVQTIRPGIAPEDVEGEEDTVWTIYSPKNRKVKELEGWRSWQTIVNALDAFNKNDGLKPRIDHT